MTSFKELDKQATRYPRTRVKKVKETIHGTKIVDNYRWLEDVDKTEVKQWLKRQNNHADNILKRIPGRTNIKKRLKELYDFEDLSIPEKRPNGWFYTRRNPTDQQAVLYFCSRYKSKEEKELVDVNKIDHTGLTSLDWFYPSHDGRLIAYGLSKDGSEWSVLHIFNLDTNENLETTIERTRFSKVIWKRDNSGFYYTRFPKPGEVPNGEEFYHAHVRYHELGTNPDNDLITFENTEKPFEMPEPFLSPDETFLIVSSSNFQANDIYLVDLTTESSQVKPIITGGKWKIITRIGKKHVYFLSNRESPNFGLYRAPIDNLMLENWISIIKPGEEILEQFEIVKENIAVMSLFNLRYNLSIYDLDGNFEREISIPENSTVYISNGNLTGNNISNKLYFSCQSFFKPTSIHECNVMTGKTEIFYETSIVVERNNFKVEKIWYPSKDGTKVHMFVIRSKNITIEGNNPTVLYGYGGFNISVTPSFSPTFIQWLELGGILAIINLRGGGEFGDNWHKAGVLGKKQNVFDDFIAAAEYLIEKKYSNSENLAIYGGSNGGLLVGAAMTQRPDLFKAVYCTVPLLDMLRYHKFSIAKFWIPEYGDPEDPEHFKWLQEYSPYHHVKKGVEYPAVLFHAAESDNRVDPSHAMKMAALMQKIAAKKPVLLQVEGKTGHGFGKPMKKIVEERVNLISFFNWQLGINRTEKY
ncbi:MAG: prolyl oligopeptidase family serine peptidase [Candidatus Hodarchaeales archaeon]|jgi:prolyl oligopeptidase